jgi:hypothetical protein
VVEARVVVVEGLVEVECVVLVERVVGLEWEVVVERLVVVERVVVVEWVVVVERVVVVEWEWERAAAVEKAAAKRARTARAIVMECILDEADV